MTALEDVLEEIGLAQYLDAFIEQGFDSWETVLDIRESDFDALGVKLGHRRKLERKIAAYRGISNTQALAPLKPAGVSDDAPSNEAGRNITPKPGTKEGSNLQPSGKRKYRRHPKPDENAPDRPPSAYVIFSNKMREDLKGKCLSFTEIAKLVGEHWQNLSATEKEPYENQAFAAKEKYTLQMADYRQTENYRKYSEYLAEFKAKQQYLLDNQEAGQDGKKPKLESLPSQTSTETSKSGSSSVIMQDPSRDADFATLDRARNLSLGPAQPWTAPDSSAIVPTGMPPMASRAHSQGHTFSPAASVSGSAHWRDQTRPVDHPLHAYKLRPERKSSQQSFYTTQEGHPPYGQSYHHQRSMDGFTPPLLTTESTGSTTQSSSTSGSTDHRGSQSSYYDPRIPVEMTRDRPSLPRIPLMFDYAGSKLRTPFEGQLPPLAHATQPPNTSTSNQPLSGSKGVPHLDFTPSHLTSQRLPYPPPTKLPHETRNQTPHILTSPAVDDDSLLDPFSALIRAGEIASGQGRQPSSQQQHISQPPPQSQDKR